MYKVQTPDGEKFLVQLVGPRSYRMGAQVTYRGQTLPVTEKTRNYLVRKTNGAWADYDPTPVEEFDEVMPPQFGDAPTTLIDMNDIDPVNNPALSLEHATMLAAGGAAHAVDVSQHYQGGEAGPVEIDTADLQATPQGAPESATEAGDMTSKDLAKASSGGKSADKPKATVKPKAEADAKTEAPKSGVTIKGAPKPADTAVEIS